jgi:enamine deaminase RidA (YjgF/YER057c/UK114 family)
MQIENRLAEIGVTLPNVPKPVASYLPVVRSGNLLFLSGQLCTVAGELKYQGKVGKEVSLEDACQAAKIAAINSLAVIYVANGFVDTAGNTLDGYKAAARVAGMVAAAQVTDSLTHAVVQRATGIVGALTNAEIEQAIQSGALVFSMSAQKQVHIESGITTFVTPTADMDAGWKKIRRMKTRDNLIERIVATWDPLIGKVDNDTDGRATLIAAAQGIINEMVGEGALVGGTLIEDKNNPPVGDSAWFLAGVDDKDSAERVYIAFGFRFSPVA